MPGPSWFARQGVKGLFKSMGADPITATVAGYTASSFTSLIFNDHHTHFVPDADHVTDVASSLSDSADVTDHVSTFHDHIETAHLHFGSSAPETYDPGHINSVAHGAVNHVTTIMFGAYDPSTSNTYIPTGETFSPRELIRAANGDIFRASDYYRSQAPMNPSNFKPS